MEAHCVNLSISESKQAEAFKGLSTNINSLLSSAKRRLLELVSLTVPFMNRRNNKGHNKDPK